MLLAPFRQLLFMVLWRRHRRLCAPPVYNSANASEHGPRSLAHCAGFSEADFSIHRRCFRRRHDMPIIRHLP